MPQNDKDQRMTDDEWWDGLDRELSHVLVGVTPAHLVIPIALAASLTAWLLS